MKIFALILLLGLNCTARAGYDEAAAALKDPETLQTKELDALLALPEQELAGSEKTAALLAGNQKALELFRQAAALPSDGYLLAQKPENPTFSTPLPKYGAHIKLLRLALLEARVGAARGQRARAEEDLLAAAGLISQLSAQRSFMLMTSLTEMLCLHKAYPVIAESLRGRAAGAAYLKELSARLGTAAKNQDAMRSAIHEEILIQKNTFQASLNLSAFELERAKLPFWKRFAAKKLQDEAFFAEVSAKIGAAEDELESALTEAFRLNDPSIAEALTKKRHAEAQAKIAAASKSGIWSDFIDGLRGGPAARARMADITVYTMVDIATPDYGKLVPRYHAGLCELGLLRAGLAVKLYQRGRGRLPDGLAQLVPAQLEAVPQDPFNKFAPLGYVKTGKKFSVYSFGPDGKDDKGAAKLDMAAYLDGQAAPAGDLVFSD